MYALPWRWVWTRVDTVSLSPQGLNLHLSVHENLRSPPRQSIRPYWQSRNHLRPHLGVPLPSHCTCACAYACSSRLRRPQHCTCRARARVVCADDRTLRPAPARVERLHLHLYLRLRRPPGPVPAASALGHRQPPRICTCTYTASLWCCFEDTGSRPKTAPVHSSGNPACRYRQKSRSPTPSGENPCQILAPERPIATRLAALFHVKHPTSTPSRDVPVQQTRTAPTGKGRGGRCFT